MIINKIIPYLGSVLLAISMHSTATAGVDASQVYVGAGGAGVYEFDANSTNVDYGFGYGYSGKIGFLPKGDGLLSHIRFEGEFVQQHNNLTRESTLGKGETTLYAGMLNTYYDFPVHKGVRPYIGVGAGYAEVDLEGQPSFGVVNETDEGVALQAMVGFAYTPKIIEKTQLYMGYRIFGITRELAFDDVSGGKEEAYYFTQSFEVGMTYRF